MIREAELGRQTNISQNSQSAKPGLDSSIEVVVRVRPLFDREAHGQSQYTNPIVTRVQDNVLFLLDPHEGSDSKFERVRREQSFAFDAAFDASATNLEVSNHFF